MIRTYLSLILVAMLPAAAAVLLALLGRRTVFSRLPYAAKQIICGTVFGLIAVMGTEHGVPLSGAQINVRDGAVLTAGLILGGPAGIIAGLIGGIERWFAVYWGIGSFTRVACSISTILAGFVAAFLRRALFEKRRPHWVLCFAVGTVHEILHMTMVLVTNIPHPSQAMAVVRTCTVPMLLINGASVSLSGIVMHLLSRNRLLHGKRKPFIAQTVQHRLLCLMLGAFLITTFFLYRLQHTFADAQAQSALSRSIVEIGSDVSDILDARLAELTARIAAKTDRLSLTVLMEEYNVSEINLIDENGIIIDSTDPDFIGFDMNTGDQSSEFLNLPEEVRIYVQPYGPISYDPDTYRKYAGVRTPQGMVQVGYNAERLRLVVGDAMQDITRNRHIGEEGFLVILGGGGRVVSAPAQYHTGMIDHTTVDALVADGKTVRTVDVEGRPYLGCMEMIESYRIIALYPESEAYSMLHTAVYVNTFLEVLVFAVLFVQVYIIIRKVVVARLVRVNESLAKITGGDLEERVNVRSNAEFDTLSDDINATVDALNRYIKEASARIDKELAMAKAIQSSALPKASSLPEHRKETDLDAYMTPAKEIGGDFYDFYLTDRDTLNFLIADVSGKGVPAALFMMRAKTELKTLTEAGLTLDRVFTDGNRALCEGNDAGMFVTAWQGRLDLVTGAASFVNAGHNPPLLKRANGRFEFLRSKAGFVLAAMETMRYRENALTLEAGDTLFLYTDGVTEATNASEALYGEKRLEAILNARDYATMEELCMAVQEDVKQFVGDAPQFDDLTMLALRYNGAVHSPAISFGRADVKDLPAVTEFAEEEMEKMDCPPKIRMQMDMAIDEIYSNIAKFAYPDGDGPVTVKVAEVFEPHGVRITFVDKGTPYNPMTTREPDLDLPAEDRPIGGLGVYLVKKMMDDMQYRYVEDCNILIIRKNFETKQ